MTIDTETPENRRRPFVLGTFVLVALFALVWAYRAWDHARTHESTENAQVDGHIVPVLAKVGGYAVAVAAAENAAVEAGAVLVQIDTTEYRQRVMQAEAELAAAVAAAGSGGQRGQAESQVATASGQRAALEAQTLAAQANAQRAKADLARGEDLARQQIISLKELDGLRANAAAADANVTAVLEQSRAAGASVTSAEAGVRLAQARLAAARASRDVALQQLAYTRVTAPEGGRVSRKAVEVGQLVQAGQPLMSIVGDSGTWVTANFKETQLDAMRVGQPVDIEVDAYPSCRATGTVESISSATGARFALLPPDNATGNFTKVVQRIPVRIAITEGCGAERPLRPGMSLAVAVKVK